MIDLLLKAAKIALPTNINDYRSFWLGCIGIRKDGAIVSAKNGAIACFFPIENYQLVPTSHAEGRVLRKLGKGGTMFVARVHKKDGSLAMSRPCGMCSTRIKSYKVDKVYYTISNSQYGIWYVADDYDRIYSIK